MTYTLRVSGPLLPCTDFFAEGLALFLVVAHRMGSYIYNRASVGAHHMREQISPWGDVCYPNGDQAAGAHPMRDTLAFPALFLT